MKKYLVMSLTIFILLLNMFVYNTYSQDVDLVIKKSNLHYNQEYVIAYGPDAELSDSSRMAVLVYRDLLQPPQRIEMNKIENEWRAAYVLSDTSVKMILLAFQALDDNGKPLPESIDNNGGEYWSIRVCDEYDIPVRGANMAVALSYTGWGDLRETDADSALDYLFEELSLYPNNYAALKMKYSLLLRQFEYSAEIRQEIDEEVMSYIYEEPENEERLNFALEVYRMIGNTKKAREIEEKIIDLDPRGDQAAAQRLSAIMKIEEVAVRLDSLENFLQEFSGSRFTEYVLSGITTAAIELGDYERMKKVGDTLLKTANQPAGAASLAGIAGVFTEKGKNLKRAVLYAKKAVELAQSFDQKIAPPEISEEDWEEYNQRLEARYQDVLGWALYQYGEPREGITYLEQAAEIMPQSSTYFHYGKALLSKEGAGIDQQIQKPDSLKESITISSGLEKAMEYLAGAVAFGGEKGEDARNLLRTVWIRTGKDTTELADFIGKESSRIEKEYRQRILSKRRIRPAPDFDLENLKGEWVQLSDQQEVVIVLCFWATWSKSSLKMLNELVELADVYGDSVLFITISTDFNWRRAFDFVRKTKFPLPVLLNDSTDKDYGLHGVPAVFVIDKKLNIHFEHKGFSENIIEVLAVEIESLL